METCAWDLHARISLSWPQLEPFAASRRDVELFESIRTTAGRSDFVRINDRAFQELSFFVCNRFAVHTTTQALLLTSVENGVLRVRELPFVADYLARLCECHDADLLSYSDNGQAECTARARHQLEWLCPIKARRIFKGLNFEAVRRSRKDRELAKLQSFNDFAKNNTHVCLGWYPYAPLPSLQKIAPAEGMSLPPLMTLRFYVVNFPHLQTRTIEQSQRQIY